MFSLFKKDSSIQLEKNYQAILERAMLAQRKGDIKLYSELSQQADDLLKKIEQAT